MQRRPPILQTQATQSILKVETSAGFFIPAHPPTHLPLLQMPISRHANFRWLNFCVSASKGAADLCHAGICQSHKLFSSPQGGVCWGSIYVNNSLTLCTVLVGRPATAAHNIYAHQGVRQLRNRWDYTKVSKSRDILKG